MVLPHRASRSQHQSYLSGIIVACCLLIGAQWGWSSAQQAFATSKEVLVTGANGRTGRIVVEKLTQQKGLGVRALVRNERSKAALLQSVPQLQPEKVIVGDILQSSLIADAAKGCIGLVIATSAVPQIKILSLVKALLAKVVGKKLRPKFRWKGGQKPELVDWEGQRNQIDEALAAGVTRIVVIGSMGGTQPDNFLNSIGEGEGDKILMWKRKAEAYIIDRCVDKGATYTIVHPGGLVDDSGGVRQLVVGVDDELLERKVRNIPRADVAEVCVQALNCKEAENRSFDLCADPVGTGTPLPVNGLAKLLSSLEGKNCDYTINPAS